MYDDSEDPVRRIANELRQPISVSPTFDARVMRAVRAAAAAAAPAGPRVWTRPQASRRITMTPLRWTAVAATIIGVVSLAVASPRIAPDAVSVDPAPNARAHVPRSQPVRFVLVAPKARKVAVVGDFNGWDRTHAAYQARHRGGGVWTVTAPVPVGHHRYSFVVDDTIWMADPAAPRAIDNDFGLPNSALVVEDAR